jgi:hypothetical protein
VKVSHYCDGLHVATVEVEPRRVAIAYDPPYDVDDEIAIEHAVEPFVCPRCAVRLTYLPGARIDHATQSKAAYLASVRARDERAVEWPED